MALKFRSGFGTVDAASKRMADQQEKRKNAVYNFFPPKDGEEVEVLFLHEEPICWMAHSLRDAKGRFELIACTEDENCVECSSSDERPREQWSWLVWDLREFEKKERDSSGKETGKTRTVSGSLKRLDRAITDASLLNKYHEKYGLTNKIWNVSKSPSGKGWVFDRGESKPLTKQMEDNIRKGLSEKLRDLSWTEILARQIAPGEYADEVPDKAATRSKVQDDIIEDDDVEEKPVKKLLKKVVKK